MRNKTHFACGNADSSTEGAARDAERLRAVLQYCEPPVGFEERVIERVHALRHAQDAHDAHDAVARQAVVSPVNRCPRIAGLSPTRRQFVAGAAAGAVGLCALGAATLFVATRDPAGGAGAPSDSGGLPAATSVAGRPFGLQVAYAAEADPAAMNDPVARTFVLEATTRGMVPVQTGNTISYFKLNFALVGENIEQVRYEVVRRADVPAPAVDGGAFFSEMRRHVDAQSAGAPFEGTVTPDNLVDEEMRLRILEWQYGPLGVSDRDIDIDYAAGIVVYSPPVDEEGNLQLYHEPWFEADAATLAAGEEGLSPQGNPYLLAASFAEEAFYATDPVLELAHAWDEQRSSMAASFIARHGFLYDGTNADPDDPEDQQWMARVAQAQAAVEDALAELRADPERFYAWMRSCYQTTLRLAAELLECHVLTVEAAFGDGETCRRVYRFARVDGYDDIVAERFDALFSYNGFSIDEDGAIRDRKGQLVVLETYRLPFWDLVAGEPDPDYPDPRLSEPLFAIVDITADDED